MNLQYYYIFHVLFMVAWFAGVFFLGRMLIYERDAVEKKEQAVIDLAQKAGFRVWYIITLPSMVLTVFFGLTIAVYIVNIISQMGGTDVEKMI